MTWDLPKTLEIGGKEYEIRSDYRDVLNIFAAIADPELDDCDKVLIAMIILFPDFEAIPHEHIEEAQKKCLWFINGGEDDDGEKSPRLIDWEQDFKLMCAPINRVMGEEIRSLDYLHWWTFLSAFYEIGGDCTFAQVISIRNKQSRHKPLDKSDKEFLKRNRKLVEMKNKYSEEEDHAIKEWI